jgi:hypothetical protein
MDAKTEGRLGYGTASLEKYFLGVINRFIEGIHSVTASFGFVLPDEPGYQWNQFGSASLSSCFVTGRL